MLGYLPNIRVNNSEILRLISYKKTDNNGMFKGIIAVFFVYFYKKKSTFQININKNNTTAISSEAQKSKTINLNNQQRKTFKRTIELLDIIMKN